MEKKELLEIVSNNGEYDNEQVKYALEDGEYLSKLQEEYGEDVITQELIEELHSEM